MSVDMVISLCVVAGTIIAVFIAYKLNIRQMRIEHKRQAYVQFLKMIEEINHSNGEVNVDNKCGWGILDVMIISVDSNVIPFLHILIAACFVKQRAIRDSASPLSDEALKMYNSDIKEIKGIVMDAIRIDLSDALRTKKRKARHYARLWVGLVPYREKFSKSKSL